MRTSQTFVPLLIMNRHVFKWNLGKTANGKEERRNNNNNNNNMESDFTTTANIFVNIFFTLVGFKVLVHFRRPKIRQF